MWAIMDLQLIITILLIISAIYVVGGIISCSIVLYQTKDFEEALQAGIMWPIGLYWVILTILRH